MPEHLERGARMIPLEYTFDHTIQKQILAMILRYPQFVASYPNVVCAEYFTDPINVLIASAYLEKQDGSYYIEPGGLLHLVASKNLLEADQKLAVKRRIKELFTLDTSDKLLAEETIRFAKHHAVIQFIAHSAENLPELVKKQNYDTLMSDLRSALDVGENVKHDGTDLLRSEPQEILQHINVGRIPTGYRILDSLIEGGLGQGELGIILAPTSAGKSITVQDMAVSSLIRRKNTTAVIITLEMSEAKYARRMFSRVTGIPKRHFAGNMLKMVKMFRYFEKKTGGRILIRQFGKATVRDIEGYVTRLQAKGIHPDVIFVDYADLLRPTFRHKDKWLEVSEIYRELRELAIDLQVPIWTPSQGNRKAYKKEILDLDDVANAFDKSMTADVVVALCRTPEEHAAGELRFFVAKNRDNEDKVQIKALMDYDSMRIREIQRL